MPYLHSFFSISRINASRTFSRVLIILSPFFLVAFLGAPVAPVSVNSLNFQYILTLSGSFGTTSLGATVKFTRSGLTASIADVSASPPCPRPSQTSNSSLSIDPTRVHHDSRQDITTLGFLSLIILEANSIGAILPSWPFIIRIFLILLFTRLCKISRITFIIVSGSKLTVIKKSLWWELTPYGIGGKMIIFLP